MKFSTSEFFNKCDQIRSKSLMEKFISYTVNYLTDTWSVALFLQINLR